jgi:asparagine synthase (glutamine-hydrolysing)
VLRKSDGKIKSLSQVIALGGNPVEHIFAHLRLAVPFAKLNFTLNPDFLALVNNLNPIDHLMNCFRDMDNNDTVNTMLAVDQKTFLPDDLLFKIDIATMRHGLEARSPFLDYIFLEFVNRIPGNLKMKWLKKKYILKQAMGDMLPAELLKRPKHGFDVPVSSWLKGRFKGLCRDIIESNQLILQIFKKDRLQKMFTEHVSGVDDYGRFFWKIIMLHFWSQDFHTEHVDTR